MTDVAAWLNARPLGSRKRTLIAVGVAALAASVATGLVGLHGLAPLVGGLAGGVLYAAALLGYQTVLTDDQQQRINLKDRFALPARRFVVFLLAALWIIVLLLASRVTPDLLDPLVGTLNVFVALALYVLLRMSAVEAIDAEITGRRHRHTADPDEDGADV